MLMCFKQFQSFQYSLFVAVHFKSFNLHATSSQITFNITFLSTGSDGINQRSAG